MCGALPAVDIERICVVFALNAFGLLADSVSEGATSLFCRGSKFTHRCLQPSVTFHGMAGHLCFRATRRIAAGEIPTICYLGANGHCGTPRRRRLLYSSKGFVCSCDDCTRHADSYRRLPCPRCCGARGESGLLRPTDELARLDVALRSLPEMDASDAEVEVAPLPLLLRQPSNTQGEKLDVDGLWVCSACGAKLSDKEVDTLCASPAEGDDEWRRVGDDEQSCAVEAAAWPLHLPSGGLFSWESNLEEAVSNLNRMLLEEPIREGREKRADVSYSPAAANSLRRLPTLLLAVRAVLGPAHSLVSTLLEMQSDHWVELAMSHSPKGARGQTERERCERRLLAAVHAEAGCRFADGMALFNAVWRRVEQLWALREQRGEEEMWETLGEVLEMLAVWGVTDAVLGLKGEPRRERARRWVAAMRRRSVCEYGEESEEAVGLRERERELACE